MSRIWCASSEHCVLYKLNKALISFQFIMCLIIRLIFMSLLHHVQLILCADILMDISRLVSCMLSMFLYLRHWYDY